MSETGVLAGKRVAILVEDEFEDEVDEDKEFGTALTDEELAELAREDEESTPEGEDDDAAAADADDDEAAHEVVPAAASGVKPKSIRTFRVSVPRRDSTCIDRPNSLISVLPGGLSLPMPQPKCSISTLVTFRLGATAN